MKILALPEVREHFNELPYILYEKEYFSYIESAERYFDELFLDIQTTLPSRLKRLAPLYFVKKYGNEKELYYALFPKSKQTTWYVFFTINYLEGEIVYLIRFISNNHVVAKYF